MFKTVTLLLITFFILTCIWIAPSQALVIPGPVLDRPERGWAEFGLLIRAEADVILVSVRYPNQGLEDNIALIRHSDGALLASVPTPAGNTNIIVDINYPLEAGETYRLVATTPYNSRWTFFYRWPVGNSEITVLSSYDDPMLWYWFSFNDITTQLGREDPIEEDDPIAIDIKPGSKTNPIRLRSKGKVPVAILSDKSFDATIVDLSTVVFAGASPLSIGETLQYVNDDGLLDVVLHFKTRDLELLPGDTEACLTIETSDSQYFEGCDNVHILDVLKVTSPNGGDTLTPGDTHTITWHTYGTKRPVEYVEIFLIKKGKNRGTKRELITTLIDNTGSYNWTVPEVNNGKTHYKVRVVLKDAGGRILGRDVSDSYFRIQLTP